MNHFALRFSGLPEIRCVPLPGHTARLHSSSRRKNSLLARYSETLGEMMLRKRTETAIRAARQEAVARFLGVTVQGSSLREDPYPAANGGG